MKKQLYIPYPTDASTVELPKKGAAELTEQMARNVHEVWTTNLFIQSSQCCILEMPSAWLHVRWLHRTLCL